MKYIFILLTLAACNNKKPQQITMGGIEMLTIPGLTAPDVYGYFASNGFITETFPGAESSVWTSTKAYGSYDLVVNTTGKKPTEIVAIDAYFKKYVNRGMNEPGRQFLADAATLPYSNSRPLLAKQWAITHNVTGGDTTIGDVSFRLTNLGDSVQILQMSVGKWR